MLAVIPHPDDESYTFGGLLALASRAGVRCVVLALTSGDQGEDHDVAATGLVTRRELELGESCRVLGCEPPRLARLGDGRLSEHHARIVADVRAALDELSPDLLLTLGPDGVYGHPDHLATHAAVCEAWSASGGGSLLGWPVYPAGLFAPQHARCVAAGIIDPATIAPDQLGGHQPRLTVDIAPVQQQKRDAIAAHRSQLPSGDPEALFPPGIVPQLMEAERFAFAGEPADARITAVFDQLAPGRATYG